MQNFGLQIIQVNKELILLFDVQTQKRAVQCTEHLIFRN